MKLFDFLFSFCVLLTYVARVSADNPLQLAKRRLGTPTFRGFSKYQLSSKKVYLANIFDQMEGDDMAENMHMCKKTRNPEICDNLGPFGKYLLMVDPAFDEKSLKGAVWQQISEVKKIGSYIESMLKKPLPLEKFLDCAGIITLDDIFMENTFLIPEDAIVGTFAGPLAEIAAVHGVYLRWGNNYPTRLIQPDEALVVIVLRSIVDTAAKPLSENFGRALVDDLKVIHWDTCSGFNSFHDRMMGWLRWIIIEVSKDTRGPCGSRRSCEEGLV